ncbi:MAG: hypothetical protein HY606_08170 [Planctomycetes bacterium]|nr:hypothetical protein [Planctomycetota bacterium]
MRSLLAVILTCSMGAYLDAKDGKISVGDDVEVKLSGGFNFDYVTRDKAILEGENAINEAGGGKMDTTNFFTGRATVRSQVTWSDKVSGLMELETRSINAGSWQTFGSDSGAMDLDVEQLYLDLKGFINPTLNWRWGVQDVRFKNAAWDDSFFMDITESESAWSGFTADGTRTKNFTFRDTIEPVGVNVMWGGMDKPCTLNVFYFDVVEGGGAISTDEQVYGAVYSHTLTGMSFGELKFGVTAVGFAGGGSIKGESLWTFGLSADAMLMDKQLEAFAEYYNQSGDTRDDKSLTPSGDIDKKAYAYQVGTRFTPNVANWQGVWAELRYTFVTGDDSPTDADDESFQSYENVDDFLVVESNDFGMDVDTNYNAWKIKLGKKDIDVAALGKLSVALKYGVFKFNEDIYGILGQTAALVTNEDQLGNELDVDVDLWYSQSLGFYFKLGSLRGSDLLDKITPSDESSTWVTVLGAKVTW